MLGRLVCFLIPHFAEVHATHTRLCELLQQWHRERGVEKVIWTETKTSRNHSSLWRF